MRILYLLCLILSLFSFSLENCDTAINNCVKKCNYSGNKLKIHACKRNCYEEYEFCNYG